MDGVEYDLPPLLPKKSGICDECGGKLVQRRDDTLQVIEERLEVYRKETEPLMEFYRKQGLIENIYVSRGVDEMVPKILDYLKRLGRKG